MAPTKKQPTRGQKQIYEENKDSIKWFTYISGGAMSLYILLIVIFSMDSISSFTSFWLPVLFSGIIYISCIQLMIYMARPVLGPTGQVLDGGIDLNMEKGFAEHLKDMILFTAFVQVISIFSNKLWWLWLIVPAWAFYLLWVNVLGPWFFAAPPEEQQQIDEKKQKKLDRRARRAQKF